MRFLVQLCIALAAVSFVSTHNSEESGEKKEEPKPPAPRSFSKAKVKGNKIDFLRKLIQKIPDDIPELSNKTGSGRGFRNGGSQSVFGAIKDAVTGIADFITGGDNGPVAPPLPPPGGYPGYPPYGNPYYAPPTFREGGGPGGGGGGGKRSGGKGKKKPGGRSFGGKKKPTKSKIGADGKGEERAAAIAKLYQLIQNFPQPGNKKGRSGNFRRGGSNSIGGWLRDSLNGIVNFVVGSDRSPEHYGESSNAYYPPPPGYYPPYGG